MTDDWRSAVVIPLYKGKGEMTECWKYRGVSLLKVFRKIYAGIFADIAHRVTEGLIDDEQGGFRAWRGCVHQIFTIRQIGEKAYEKEYVDLWI